MEAMIVIGIVLGSLYYTVRVFKKQADGKDGCRCSRHCGPCGKQTEFSGPKSTLTDHKFHA